MASCLECDGDCCRRYRVPLTDGDLRRLTAAGRPLSEFVDWVPVASMYCTYADVRLTGGYFYMVLKRSEDGSCVLSRGENGALRCGVHGEHPLLCRIYPFRPDGGLISHRMCKKGMKPWRNLAELAALREFECGEYSRRVRAWNGSHRARWGQDMFLEHILDGGNQG